MSFFFNTAQWIYAKVIHKEDGETIKSYKACPVHRAGAPAWKGRKMEVNLKQLESTLNQAEVIYLSTSKQDVVSSRPVSPLNIGLRLFVRTSAATRKAKEMTANPNIAVCAGNFYFTGKAKPLGSVHDAGNAQVKAAYMARYPDSFGKEDEFIQSDEVFFELTIENVSEWIFAGGNPTGFAEQHVCPDTIGQ